jgi:thymidine kinase
MDLANLPTDILRPTGAVAASRGTIELIVGCMFSGKTTLLLQRIRGHAPRDVCAFKHSLDQRYRPDRIVAHHGDTVSCRAVSSEADIAAGVAAGMRLCAIDEAHFFGAGLVGVIDELADRGVAIVLTGLDLDSWGRPFGVMETLRARANRVLRQWAVCGGCGAPADHTQRLTPIIGGDLVGGPESYEPRCAACWHRPPEPPPE